MKGNCLNCGKETEIVGAMKYCSPKCKKDAKRKRENKSLDGTRTCPCCGISFMPDSNRQVFHSKECWKEANLQKLKDKSYRGAMRHHDKVKFGGNRELALIRDGYKCTKCGSTEDIGVHHIDKTGKKENPNHALENLVTLCNHCHALEHNEDRNAKRRTAFLTTCQYCGGLFKTTPYRISIGAGKYCKKECKDAGMVKLDRASDLRPADKPNWFKVNCANCGVEFSVPPYRLKRGKTLYCGRKCRTEAENRKRAGKYKITHTENMGKGRSSGAKKKPPLDLSTLPEVEY
jgi:5-methylcytosine-specific restriction endonuclease McrA